MAVLMDDWSDEKWDKSWADSSAECWVAQREWPKGDWLAALWGRMKAGP